MNDLLQRLSASGEKIGVECKRVYDDDDRMWLFIFGNDDAGIANTDSDIALGKATMLLLKALEAKGYWHVLAFRENRIYFAVRPKATPEAVTASEAPAYFEAVLKATVEVVEGL